ncbi:ABC transporter ATP-binding protein [Thermoflexus hugenholtzii]|jgi:amino acid/amide ABC transporter ATP-binding protein 2, HAAT family (TC 3.A.1.4.-)|uniref:Amino acid/amide ABC transporter ATP-binding protein 2, HAAT family n=1 Tax=Thermoflexus hugenholtzii JAD2 TaxID=877466 RepID=A0A212QV98_9CHLR|nr:ABC transporter ATP-binding protein [Thermoflexus hugenholtzii]SNB63625.1 amino acid/amide ABC transporter ATP-binding protein 2, HAAT family [Thermoflexus hugenholtzii JAD2]
MSVVLSLSAVTAGYGPILALREVSLEVREGEVVALLGANGAGKTTTLRVIAGLLPTLSGSIAFEGRPLHPLPPEERVARGIVLVPEGRGIFPELTVEENLWLGAWRRRDLRAARADLERVFHLFPILRERRRQLAGTLSGGEQQMLAIGRALMAQPRLLLLDEPSLGLAPLVVRHIFEVLRAIHEAGTPLLIAEQNAHLALTLAHRAYILQNGEIRLQGEARVLRENPEVKALYLGR